MEQLCLYHIASYGLTVLPNHNIAMPSKVCNFRSVDKLSLPREGKCVLYLPGAFNFPAIDAMVIDRCWKNDKDSKANTVSKKDKKSVTVYPIQITIADQHSDSEAKFIERWNKSWHYIFKQYKCKDYFCLVRINGEGPHTHEQKNNFPGMTVRHKAIGSLSDTFEFLINEITNNND